MANTQKNLPSWLSEDENLVPPAEGSLVKGKIIFKSKNELWVEVGKRTIGVVPPREIKDGLGTMKSLKVGEDVTAYVLSPENEQGYMVLSLKRAARQTVWDILEKKMESKEEIEVTPSKANRGGLIVVLHGIQGFLPVSQLSLEHYPRVKDANREEILAKLKRLTLTPMKVRVLDVNRKEKKLIFSEKATFSEDVKDMLKKLSVGDVVDGTVSGVVNFGVFIKLDKGVEGLIHISEIAWEHVANPSDYFSEGQRIKAKVIEVDEDKVSLSTRQLTEDPWIEHTKGIELGKVVSGKVTRIVPFGALVKVNDFVDALAHITELSEKPLDKASQIVEVGKSYKFKVIEFDPTEHRMGVSLKGVENENLLDQLEKKDAEKSEKKTVAKKVEEKSEKKKEEVVSEETRKSEVLKSSKNSEKKKLEPEIEETKLKKSVKKTLSDQSKTGKEEKPKKSEKKRVEKKKEEKSEEKKTAKPKKNSDS